MDRRVDLAVALIVVAFGIAVIVIASQIDIRLAIDPVGPRAFGYALGILFVVGGGAIAVRRRLRWQTTDGGHEIPSEGTPDEAGHPSNPWRPIAVGALTLGYAAGLARLGYVILTPIYLGLMMHTLRARGTMSSRVVLPLVYMVLTYAVFTQVLQVNLPVGPLRPLFVRWSLVNY